MRTPHWLVENYPSPIGSYNLSFFGLKFLEIEGWLEEAAGGAVTGSIDAYPPDSPASIEGALAAGKCPWYAQYLWRIFGKIGIVVWQIEFPQ